MYATGVVPPAISHQAPMLPAGQYDSRGMDDMDSLQYRDLEGPNKKRKSQSQRPRACDLCRRKKVRCDFPEVAGDRCTNCAIVRQDCTFVSQAAKRSPPLGYVDYLEDRIIKLENFISRIAPGTHMEEEFGSKLSLDAWTAQNNRTGFQPRSSSMETQTQSEFETPELPDNLTDEMEKLSLKCGIEQRFHGKSSGVMLVQAAIEMQKSLDGHAHEDFTSFPKRDMFWGPTDYEASPASETVPPLTVIFPPMDLAYSLFDLFFRHIAPFLPIIHRQTFESQYADHLHHRQSNYAIVLLLVCATASKYSDDPRVCIDGRGKRSAGWVYFTQAQNLCQAHPHAPPKLDDLQKYALLAYHLHVFAPNAALTVVAIGLREAQSIGCHRRRKHDGSISLEEELLKRVFWYLVSLDRTLSVFLGRPLGLQDEDIDADYPEEIDDEYLHPHNPATEPRQPDGVPSIVAYFNYSLVLQQIFICTLRTCYSDKPYPWTYGPRLRWPYTKLANLDATMDRWITTLPPHLRWDPHNTDQIHFEQSAALHANYYHLQMLAHRPTISQERDNSHLPPSLVVCLNAVRSCASLVDVLRARSRHVYPDILMPSLGGSVMAFIGIWGAQTVGATMDVRQSLRDVDKFLRFFHSIEDTWHCAGKYADIIRILARLDNLLLPDSNYPPSGIPHPIPAPERPGSNTVNERERPPTFAPSFHAPIPRKASHHFANHASVPPYLVSRNPSFIPPISNTQGVSQLNLWNDSRQQHQSYDNLVPSRSTSVIGPTPSHLAAPHPPFIHRADTYPGPVWDGRYLLPAQPTSGLPQHDSYQNYQSSLENQAQDDSLALTGQPATTSDSPVWSEWDERRGSV